MSETNGESAPLPCCIHLRCRSLCYRTDEGVGLLHRDSSREYWCCLTNAPMGPDGRVVLHPVCQPGRVCFEGRSVGPERE